MSSLWKPVKCILFWLRGLAMPNCRLLQRCSSHGVQPTLAMRGAFLAACECHGLWAAALAVYHQSPDTDTAMCNSLLCMSRAHGQWQWNLRLFSEAATSSASACISSLSRCFRWTRALQVLNSLSAAGSELGAADWDAAINTGHGGANWEKSLHLMQQRLQEQQASLHGFTAAMSVSQQAQQWRCAADMLMGMQHNHLVPNAVSCSIAIAAVQEFRHWEWASDILRAMPRFGAPNCHCFNALISCCEKARAWAFALQSVLRMQMTRLAPDGITRASSISSCEKGLQWTFAVSLFHQALESDERSIKSKERIQSIQRSAALSACSRSSKWLMAIAVLRVGKRPEVLTVASAMFALSSRESTNSELQKARKWLHQVNSESGSGLFSNFRESTVFLLFFGRSVR